MIGHRRRTTAEERRKPMKNIRMKVGGSKFIEEKIMINGIKSFGDIHGGDESPPWRLLLIETRSDTRGEGKKRGST